MKTLWGTAIEQIPANLLPCQVGSRCDGLVSHVKDFGIHVILGDGRAGLGHAGPLSGCDACDVLELYL